MAGGEGPAKRSDLGVRTVSAIVMVAVAGGALWLGGWFWAGFVGLVAAGVLWEWRGLVSGFVPSPMRRGLWNAGGFVYIGVAAAMLLALREDRIGMTMLVAVVAGVIATDIGAYFAGRAIGGPKIAPRISPSKTWAGLGGGIVGASLVGAAVAWRGSGPVPAGSVNAFEVIAFGVLLAVTAQAGDFFESWMKRRAGVKDSSRLIPGHGGLFDRVDGLLAVLFVAGLMVLLPAAWILLSGQSPLPSPA
jgi:phosphatidate cytidylyltransferase